MKTSLTLSLLGFCAFAQTAPGPPAEELERGYSLIATPNISSNEHLPLVESFHGLRVTDVVDALQAVGLQDVTSMDDSIRPVWRDQTNLTHRIYGMAVTARYVPTNKRMPTLTVDEFRRWHQDWYDNIAPPIVSRILKPGTILVIDAHDVTNTGFIGSGNSLGWKGRGMAGVITNGGARDTDEIILQKIPVYSKHISHGTRPGRIEVESLNRPVVVGGALVIPGDIVVADGDGVVVVPRKVAAQVAEIAWEVADKDKTSRRSMYEKQGVPLDQTVQPKQRR